MMLGWCLCTSLAGQEGPLGCQVDACCDTVLLPFPHLRFLQCSRKH